MKGLISLVFIVSIISVSAFKFNNPVGASIFNQGVKFGGHINEQFNKFSNPKNSITYNNPVLDFAIKIPLVGDSIDAISTGFKLGEGIGEHIATKINKNKIKFPAI